MFEINRITRKLRNIKAHIEKIKDTLIDKAEKLMKKIIKLEKNLNYIKELK